MLYPFELRAHNHLAGLAAFERWEWVLTVPGKQFYPFRRFLGEFPGMPSKKSD
jgi:hypothetical protein